jgi:hypothetical protein
MSLPYFQSAVKELSLLQTRWAAIIDPFLSRISNSANILDDVPLKTGNNVINHKLGRKLKGWRIIRQDAAASIYDAQATNQSPDLTLVLISSAPCLLSLEVF